MQQYICTDYKVLAIRNDFEGVLKVVLTTVLNQTIDKQGKLIKLQIDTEKLHDIIQGLSSDLDGVISTSEIPIYQYKNKAGELCQLKVVATKDEDEDEIIYQGKQFHCLSLKEE